VKPLPAQLNLDLQRDATAADLRADLAGVVCPLGCTERPRFQGRRNRRLRFFCDRCHLTFEVMPRPRVEGAE
jgi:transposase-like protein